MVSLSVVICTYNRHQALATAVRSVRRQVVPPTVRAEVVVVDNSADGNAAGVLAALAAEPGLPLRVIACPRPNVSLARNAGVAGTVGDYLVFLDDDQWVEDGWLAALVETAERSGADAVFGAVLPVFDQDPPAWDVSGRSYQRLIPWPTGTALSIHHDQVASGRWIGTGNALLRRATCLTDPLPFDPRLGFGAGEDYDLFVRLDRRDRRFVWCAEAPARESVPADRTGIAYRIRRSYLEGRTWSIITIRHAPVPVATAVTIFIRASVQIVLVAALWLSKRLGQPAAAPVAFLKLAEVTGKLLWWRPLAAPRAATKAAG